MTATTTLAPGAKMIQAETLARAWLAAAGAGQPSKWDPRYDRVVLLEQYPEGWTIVGVSLNMIVVAHAPYEGFRPSAVYDAALEGDPILRVIANDSGSGSAGAVLLRSALARANAERKIRQTPLLATIGLVEHVPEGGMVGHRQIEVAIDRLGLAYVDIATHAPAPWRDGLPSATSELHVARSSLLREPTDALGRLARIIPHVLDGEEAALDWELHRLPSGALIRWAQLDAHGARFELAVAAATEAEEGAPAPTIFVPEHKPDAKPAARGEVMPDEIPDRVVPWEQTSTDGIDPSDPNGIIRRALGEPGDPDPDEEPEPEPEPEPDPVGESDAEWEGSAR